MGGISVLNSAALTATVRAIAAAPTAIRREIRQRTNAVIRPAWEAEIREAAGSSPQPLLASRVISGPSRVAASDRQLRASVTARRKATSGGLIPAEHGRAVEFGSNGTRTKSYSSQRKGRVYKITNRKTTQQLQPRRQRGSVFYKAGNDMIPRALSMWAQTTVRTILDAWEGKT